MSYDALNRRTDVKEPGTTDLATHAYDDLSQGARVTLGNRTTASYGYDNQSALSSLTHNLAGTAQDNTGPMPATWCRSSSGIFPCSLRFWEWWDNQCCTPPLGLFPGAQRSAEQLVGLWKMRSVYF
ncbi:MAG TPA: hypothetical protein VHB01_11725 [Nitrosospira sp.]|nr:hypothetical protein [Nitrosospira sp.]